MKSSPERLSDNNEAGRPITPLEAKTQTIINKAAETGLAGRIMLPEVTGLPLAQESIETVSKIDFSFDARKIRDTKTCEEAAEMIAGTLAPSIEMAHRLLVSPDFYHQLQSDGLSFIFPFEAQHLPTGERIICGGKEGQQPKERHFITQDEHNRLTCHVIGKRLNANGSPTFIDFYAWEYASDSKEYTPIGGLHSRFFYKTEVDYPTQTWQEVSLYKLHDCPKLKNPAKELYRLTDTKIPQEQFFLRLIDGRIIVAHSGSQTTQTDRKSLLITYCDWWHHRPSILFGMYEGAYASKGRYGFDVKERTDESWMYEHCEMNHSGYSCPNYLSDNGCKLPQAA